ncbi:hypothetical protein Q6245_30550, partial [Klebsiella pneumoniae]|uniref:hypothetical protein n=1 Tax=Klebsiella pneumoniae TaxID=573 RepID=UPI002732033A
MATVLPPIAKLRESALVIEQSWMPSIENIHDSAAYVASIRSCEQASGSAQHTRRIAEDSSRDSQRTT